MYSRLGYQTRIVQTISLGAYERDRCGDHARVINLTIISDDFIEFATEASKSPYATPTMRVSQRAERAHVAMATAMRAPVEGSGPWALEGAIDELAAELRIDPITCG